MPSFIDSIINQYSLPSVLAIVALIGIYLTYVKNGKKIFSKDKDGLSTISSEDRKKELLNHEYFRNMDLKIDVELGITSFSKHEVRNSLIHDMTKILFKIQKEEVYDFVKKMDAEMDGDKLLRALSSLQFEIMRLFEQECMSKDIPSQALLAYKTWFVSNLKVIHYHMSNICRPSVSSSTVDRVRTFLFILQIVMINTLNDLQKKPVINGTLNDLTYKGRDIERD